MRVHSLQLEAFGPFAKRAAIDFDALSEGGIFLLNGETGAGKTSVLDGICYALYGSLPGVRQGSKSLRSDHAEASVAPEVVCEFSTGGRRFEVTRSPAWDKPSKRGKNGTTTAQAQSRLREFVDGTWIEKSTRNDEVGHLLAELLGLDKEQFTKVAMLPQGAFAAFLRAKDKDREDLLRSLFDTSEYTLTEKVLAERFAAAKAEAEDAERNQRTAVDQLVTDALATLFPERAELPAELAVLRDSADLGTLGELGEELAVLLSGKRAALAAEQQVADAQAGTARAAEALLADRVRRHAQLAELRELRTAHEEQDAEVASLRGTLALDTAAAAIAAYHQQSQDAARARDAAEATLRKAAAAREAGSGGSPEHPDAGGRALINAAILPGAGIEPVTALAGHAGDAASGALQLAAVIEAALPDEQELASARSDLEKLLASRQTQLLARDRRTAETAELNAALPGLEAACASSEQVLASLPALREALALATERRGQVAERAKAEHAQLKVHGEFNDAKTRTLSLREAVATLVSLRLDQSAATLAAQLREGQACLVCGSQEHPEPAVLPEGELVDVRDIERAQEQAAAAEAAERKVAERLEQANTTLALVTDKIGALDHAGAEADVDTATLALAEATASATAADAAATALARATASLGSLATDAATAATALEVTDTRIETTEARIAKLAASLAALSAGGQDLKQRHAQLLAEASSNQLLATAANSLLAAQTAALAADVQWDAKLAEAGIPDTATWLDRLLPADERTAHQQRVDRHAEQSVRIKTLAADPDTERARTEAASGIGAPDAGELEDAAGAVREAADRRDGVLARDAVLESYTGRLVATRSRLAELAGAQGPVLERFATLKSMADLARGLGENRLKMTLSTYVLAARLEAVALAATQRLLVMSGQRYSLVHDDSPRGNNKSGLGLQILDSWTGVRRDTQTLSGGESFMASLSLALGLADVIQQQSGGIDIETLFVDEGFGSLDGDTLEQVMDALEALRSGGRVIGVVSHVTDMKQRITTQLHVHKGRNGSTVSMAVPR